MRWKPIRKREPLYLKSHYTGCDWTVVIEHMEPLQPNLRGAQSWDGKAKGIHRAKCRPYLRSRPAHDREGQQYSNG